MGNARRPQDGDGNSSAVFDRGAVEKQAGPPPNRPPNAENDSASTAANTAVQITVTTNDSDPDNDVLTVSGFTQGTHGGVSFAQNVATYAPTFGFSGEDTFTYTINDGRGGSDSATVTVTIAPSACPSPVISSIRPLGGPVGTPITITGTNLDCGSTRMLTCGSVPLVITSISPTQITSFIPPGAQDCRVVFTTAGGAVTVPPEQGFDVILSRDFSLTMNPTGMVIPGSSTPYRVVASGADSFTDLITLSVSGLPTGVSGSFFPETITAGQSATLTVEAANDAPLASSVSLTVTGTAQVDGQTVSHATAASLTVLGGQTALLGQFVLTKGPPLVGVQLKLTKKDDGIVLASTETDAAGNFQFLNVPAGTHTLGIDASHATPADPGFPLHSSLPIYGMDVPVFEGVAFRLNTFHLFPPPPPEQFTPLQNQTHDQVIADPRFPGAAYIVPAGASIIGWDGVPKTQITMERLSPGELPIPPPPGAVPSVYQPFFGTPMGGIPSKPIAVSLPNELDLDPGEKAELWYYDAAPFTNVPGAWRLAGTGTVSMDGTKIVSDEKLGDGVGDDDGVCEEGEVCVGIERFCGVCGTWCFIKNQDNQPNENPDGDTTGDPVSVGTGLFLNKKTDLVLSGLIPAVLHRTFNPYDPFNQVAGFEFGLGKGWSLSVDVALIEVGTSVRRLILPGNSRFAFSRQPDGNFIHLFHPRFAGAVLTAGASGEHLLRFRDGAVWRFAAGWVSGPPIPDRALPGLGLLVEIIDRNGNHLTIERERHGRIARLSEPAGRTLSFTLDASLRIAQVTDPIGRTVRYGYNGSGLLETVTDPAGGVTRYEYFDDQAIRAITDPKGIVFLRNTYTDLNQIVRQTLADGSEWKFAYKYDFSFGGESSDPCSPLPICIDTDGLLGLPQKPNGSGGSCETCAVPTPLQRRGVVGQTVTADPLGRKTHYYLDRYGFTEKVIDATGQTTLFERLFGSSDQLSGTFNQIASITDPLGRKSSFTYDDSGNVTSITDPQGNVRRVEYDPIFNQITRVTDPLGNSATFTYDSHGNLVRVTDPLGHVRHIAYNQFGQPVSVADPLGSVTTFTYDLVGNLSAITNPLGQTSRIAYDRVSRVSAVTDGQGKTTRFSYNAFDRVTQIIDAAGGVTRFTYDANSNLLSVTDAHDHTTTYEYDNMDRLVRRTDPLGTSETFAYDLAGNLVRHTDRKGQVGAFSYDPLNRRVRADYADSSTSFVYDAVGRLVRASDSLGGDIINSYDVLDRLIEQTTGVGSIQYDYDAAGRRTAMSVLGQPPVAYGYDANSRLTQLSQGGHNVDFDYDAAGHRTQLTLPNQVSTEYRYDVASRLKELIYRSATDTLGNLTYTYDAAGNRTQVGGSFARTLLPDPVASATYDAANRQLAFGDNEMTFDANGNMVSITAPGDVTNLTWDARDRLTDLVGPGATAAFAYDAFGRRSEKTVNTRMTRYVHDRWDVVQELTGGMPVNLLRSLNIDELLVRNGAEHVLADALGSTVALTAANGTALTEYTYEPFGRTIVTGTASSNSFQYTGRENDGADLYSYRARYYHPQLGRFVSEDFVRRPRQGGQLYTYVLNNPLLYVDPLGLWTVGGGVQGTAASGGIVVSGSIGVFVDSQGNISVIRSGGWGGTSSIGGVSGGVFGQVSTAENVTQLEGLGYSTSITGGAGILEGGLEYFGGSNYQGGGGYFGVGKSFPLPVSGTLSGQTTKSKCIFGCPSKPPPSPGGRKSNDGGGLPLFLQ